VVSIIFVPISFLTRFFGVNFNWMAEHLGGGDVFWGLSVLLPLACAVATIMWMRRR